MATAAATVDLTTAATAGIAKAEVALLPAPWGEGTRASWRKARLSSYTLVEHDTRSGANTRKFAARNATAHTTHHERSGRKAAGSWRCPFLLFSILRAVCQLGGFCLVLGAKRHRCCSRRWRRCPCPCLFDLQNWCVCGSGTATANATSEASAQSAAWRLLLLLAT